MNARALGAVIGVLVMACGDSGSTTGGADAGGSSADGGAGGATATGGDSSTGGAGGSTPLRCPDICEAFAAVFESYACAFDQCNCKEPCADLHQAAIDCLADNDPFCECDAGGNELQCDDTCAAENMAANACFSAN